MSPGVHSSSERMVSPSPTRLVRQSMEPVIETPLVPLVLPQDGRATETRREPVFGPPIERDNRYKLAGGRDPAPLNVYVVH